MSDKQTVGSVTYKQVGKEYFEQRGLRRYAKVLREPRPILELNAEL